MKLPTGAGAAAMVSGGRVLRSQSAKTVLVDTKLSFKAKKTKESAKREGEAPAESVVAEVVKKPKKTTTRTKKTTMTTTTSTSSIGVAAVGSDVAKLWSVSLSTEGALAEATKHLVAADAKLKQIIESHGAGPVWEHKGSAFSSLARAIVYQQLAGRAADVIYGRLITLCGVSALSLSHSPLPSYTKLPPFCPNWGSTPARVHAALIFKCCIISSSCKASKIMRGRCFTCGATK